MKVETTSLQGVLLVTPDKFTDHRGTYTESYNIEEYLGEGIPQLFVQDDFSISTRNVLRGIHGDGKTWKLVSCPMGAICLVVVNFDLETPEHFQWEKFILTEENYQQVLIPPKFGNGHLVLSNRAMFHYKQSSYYQPEIQFSIPYNHPKLGIDWPWLDADPITSERDKKWTTDTDQS